MAKFEIKTLNFMPKEYKCVGPTAQESLSGVKSQRRGQTLAKILAQALQQAV